MSETKFRFSDKTITSSGDSIKELVEKNKANLAGADFSDVDLFGINLPWANLAGADFSDVDFSEADLFRTDFSGADFSDVDFSEADLFRTDFSGADFSDVDFSKADLSNVDFSEADLSNVDFSEADLFGASFFGANLHGVDFSEADLSRTNFSGASFSKVNFYMTSLYRANLEFPKFPSIRFISQIRLHHLSPDLTLELMRRDASAHPCPEKFDKWAKGGPCPYQNEERFWLFEEKRQLWKAGKPRMRDSDLIIEICKSQGWKIKGYLEEEMES